MTNVDVTKTNEIVSSQDGKMTLSGYGFRMEITANGQPVLFDAEGKEIIEAQQRMDAQKILVAPFIRMLETSFSQEIGVLQQASAKDVNISDDFNANFELAANDNFQHEKIGYITSAGLMYMGINKEDSEYKYTIGCGYMTWFHANEEVKKINQEGKYIKEYGDAKFPTKGEMYNNFYLNLHHIGALFSDAPFNDRRAWGLDGDFDINGKYAPVQYHRGTYCYARKSSKAILCPLWSLKHPAI